MKAKKETKEERVARSFADMEIIARAAQAAGEESVRKVKELIEKEKDALDSTRQPLQ